MMVVRSSRVRGIDRRRRSGTSNEEVGYRASCHIFDLIGVNIVVARDSI
jgi:hypothetical protein